MSYYVLRNNDNDWIDGFGDEFPDASIEQGIPRNVRFYRTDLAQEYYWNGASWTAVVGGAGIAVQEVDGAPAVAGVSTVKFDSADGLVVTDEGGGVVRIDYTQVLAPTAHAASHQNAGSDEISVAGLSGVLADPQTPAAHASSHQALGADSIKLDDLAAPDDNTDLNATTLVHGLLRKLDGNTSNFLRGDGAWAAPAAAPAPDQDARIYGLLGLMGF